MEKLIADHLKEADMMHQMRSAFGARRVRNGNGNALDNAPSPPQRAPITFAML